MPQWRSSIAGGCRRMLKTLGKADGFADHEIPFWNGYFIGKINPTFSDKPRMIEITGFPKWDVLKILARSFDGFSEFFHWSQLRAHLGRQKSRNSSRGPNGRRILEMGQAGNPGNPFPLPCWIFPTRPYPMHSQCSCIGKIFGNDQSPPIPMYIHSGHSGHWTQVPWANSTARVQPAKPGGPKTTDVHQ